MFRDHNFIKIIKIRVGIIFTFYLPIITQIRIFMHSDMGIQYTTIYFIIRYLYLCLWK